MVIKCCRSTVTSNGDQMAGVALTGVQHHKTRGKEQGAERI